MEWSDWRHELTTPAIPSASPTHIDSNSVISILISSEFLQMHNLVNKCLQYTHDAISEIIALPIVSDEVTDSITSTACNYILTIRIKCVLSLSLSLSTKNFNYRT